MVTVNGLVFERRVDGAVVIRKYNDPAGHGGMCLFEQIIEDWDAIVGDLDVEQHIMDAAVGSGLAFAPGAKIEEVRAEISRRQAVADTEAAAAADRAQREATAAKEIADAEAAQAAADAAAVAAAEAHAKAEADAQAKAEAEAKEIADAAARAKAETDAAEAKAIADAKAKAEADAIAAAAVPAPAEAAISEVDPTAVTVIVPPPVAT